MSLFGCLLWLFLLGLVGLLQSDAVRVEVKEDNKMCIFADLMVIFTVQYEANQTVRIATIPVPENVSTEGSTCGNQTVAPLLNLNFGSGYSWSINFTSTNTSYKGDVITLKYNLSDATFFPGSKEKGEVTVSTLDTMTDIPLNTAYRCMSVDIIKTEKVNQTFQNVTLQAFVNGTVSKNVTVCKMDVPTTVAPTTNSPTAPPTKPPTPPKPDVKPTKKTYKIKNGNETCLLATMGLQLNFSYNSTKPTWKVLNLNPNVTNANGTCGDGDEATLRLDDHTMVVTFTFAVKNSTRKFYLKEVLVNVRSFDNGSAPFYDGSTNLSYWEASLGSSYMCSKEQKFKVTDRLSFNTFELRVQPFKVEGESYATAEECFADSDLGFLVPFAVGLALTFLIILVLISYLIGRKKSDTGYQSV
ncbi:lysosome-associated membrane glycoprotein 2 isoform X1 [Latimeria chalumnae]|uniref:lysosome-associated membrane glycoprotein 2 isoform X1 n=1 Tax=Latimeria chalumnae TaxID=7897 RepID=UPI0003C18561|nr:PREDICTED: lysosome-associated membrane glycoprotein 2 isoform X1 [Latimeria chalumnae]|eukprot:XP_006003901.1 PREDICTED: lysosome-associated membrane glycoprotein 2 isoform X1 [Latimeria chalumnae]